MITYLISSTLCMGVLLIYYHAVMEKEKVYRINRAYLLFSLIFSLTVPLIPVGISGSFFTLSDNILVNDIQTHKSFFSLNNGKAGQKHEEAEAITPIKPIEESGYPYKMFFNIAFYLYSIVTLIFLIGFLWKFLNINRKTAKSSDTYFQGYKVIFIPEKIVPHTFMETIFVNKEQYLNGEIGRVILLHELEHAKQKHTLDILFVEVLKIIFWFNPIIYFYKKAILLNHEFIADEAVISKGIEISVYQKLLLETLKPQPIYGLSNNLTYLTKKRFQMMNQTTSNFGRFVKVTALVPLFVMMGLFLGCEPASMNEASSNNEFKIEFLNSGMIGINGKRIKIIEFDEYISEFPKEKKALFRFFIQPNTPIGDVWDIQKIIRSQGVHYVKYSLSNSEKHVNISENKLNLIVENYEKSVKNYLEIEAVESNMNDLKSQYETVKLWHNAIVIAQGNGSDNNTIPPPPPPRPYSPEKRLQVDLNVDYQLKETSQIKPPEPKPKSEIDWYKKGEHN